MTDRRDENAKYKDDLRHGGKRSELIAMFGLTCSACGVSGSGFGIVAHHLTGNPQEHALQILLCRPCHATLHMDGVDKKPRTREEILAAVRATNNLHAAGKLVGLSHTAMKKRIKKYGIGRPCGHCKKEFTPTPQLKRYCSEECQVTGKKEKQTKHIESYKERQVEIDRGYRERHKEALAERKRKYYLEHAEAIKARTREWYKNRKSLSTNGSVLPEEGTPIQSKPCKGGFDSHHRCMRQGGGTGDKRRRKWASRISLTASRVSGSPCSAGTRGRLPGLCFSSIARPG